MAVATVVLMAHEKKLPTKTPTKFWSRLAKSRDSVMCEHEA